jgi:hypothetical protein
MTANAWAIDFQNPVTGERKTVVLEETAAEIECVRIHRLWAFHQSMHARARRELPPGFEQIIGSGRAVPVH